MMLAVPFATLEVPDIVAECCCPSPEVCRCPDHEGEHDDQSSMRSCHRTSHHLAVSKLASFTPSPPLAAFVPPAPALVAIAFVPVSPPTPHVPRPDAPS